jgi:hypothetical protein
LNLLLLTLPSQDIDDGDCGTTDYTALDLIVRSMINIHRFYKSFYDSLDSVQLNMQTFCKTVCWSFAASRFGFAKLRLLQLASEYVEIKIDPLELLKKMLGFVDILFAVAGAGVWEKVKDKTRPPLMVHR